MTGKKSRIVGDVMVTCQRNPVCKKQQNQTSEGRFFKTAAARSCWGWGKSIVVRSWLSPSSCSEMPSISTTASAFCAAATAASIPPVIAVSICDPLTLFAHNNTPSGGQSEAVSKLHYIHSQLHNQCTYKVTVPPGPFTRVMASNGVSTQLKVESGQICPK